MSQHFSVEFEQDIDLDREQVFDFFADAQNLERITPPFLRFRIASQLPIEMCEGAEILYRLKIHGISVSWRTRIKVWEPPFRFVDEQIAGPYKRWVHEHRFEEHGCGTRMFDRVDYQPPGGPFAGLINRLVVRSDVAKIFAWRSQAIERELLDQQLVTTSH